MKVNVVPSALRCIDLAIRSGLYLASKLSLRIFLGKIAVSVSICTQKAAYTEFDQRCFMRTAESACTTSGLMMAMDVELTK